MFVTDSSQMTWTKLIWSILKLIPVLKQYLVMKLNCLTTEEQCYTNSKLYNAIQQLNVPCFLEPFTKSTSMSPRNAITCRTSSSDQFLAPSSSYSFLFFMVTFTVFAEAATFFFVAAVALFLGALGATWGGCTLHYVWESRAFMTPSKNPIVYERLYV